VAVVVDDVGDRDVERRWQPAEFGELARARVAFAGGGLLRREPG